MKTLLLLLPSLLNALKPLQKTFGKKVISDSCVPPSDSKINWNSNQCSDSYYGITTEALTYSEALSYCSSINSKLLIVHDPETDACASAAISSSNFNDQMLLYSGLYSSTENIWKWSDNSVFDYTNWLQDSSFIVGDCMGGYYDNSKKEYGWVERACTETQVHAVCQYNCDQSPIKKQYLAYMDMNLFERGFYF